jgi:hypothetical protein
MRFAEQARASYDFPAIPTALTRVKPKDALTYPADICKLPEAKPYEFKLSSAKPNMIAIEGIIRRGQLYRVYN